jgi:uncharacterized protein with von Willebrand factor type A (vWA) domain
LFIPFFYLLRARGLNPSIIQWMTLMEALNRDMAQSSLTGFYHLCRCTLLCSEADFDKFDEAFIEFFQGVNDRVKLPEDLPVSRQAEGMMDWLSVDPKYHDLYYSEEHMQILLALTEVIERILKKMEEQIGSGNFIGSCEVCSGCGLCMRSLGIESPENAEMAQQGATYNERSRKHPDRALAMAHDRRFRDFRDDTVLDIRQFQMAFRKLRQNSTRNDSRQLELDIDQTVRKTSENAGLLRIVFRKPRKNVIKLIVLLDSDGSMSQFADLSNRLFQAARKTNHFKDLKFYYYHNCVYDHLYESPLCVNGKWVETDYVLRNLDGEYRVIFVGDASMADSELFRIGGNILFERSNILTGQEWLNKIKKKYRKSVWLNPIPKEEWDRLYGGKSIQTIKEIYPMYELTVSGLGNAVGNLLSAR